MEKIEKLLFKYILLVAVLVLSIVYWGHVATWFYQVWQAAMPLITALVIAYLLNLLVVRYEKLLHRLSDKYRRGVSLMLAVVTIICVLIIVLRIVVPQVVSAVSQLVEGIPVAVARIQRLLDEHQLIVPQISEYARQLNVDFGQVAQKAVAFINQLASSSFSTLLKSTTNIAANIVNLVLSVMLSFYVILSKESLAKQFNRVFAWALPEQHHRRLLHVLSVANDSFSNFITGMLTEAFILGTLVTVGMIVLRFPYASMIGVLAGVLALIPVLGAYLSATIGFVMILAVSPSQAIGFLVFILIVQQIEGNLIYPRIMGNSIGLPGIWVTSSVALAGGVFGVVGMMVGVPLAATVYKLLRETIEHDERKKATRV